MCNLIPSQGLIILIKKQRNYILKGGQAYFPPFAGFLVQLSYLALKNYQRLFLCHGIELISQVLY